MTFAVPDLPVYSPDHWMRDALCAQTDPEAFFPNKGGSAATAAQVCRSCPVQAECLEATLTLEEASGYPFGYAGGKSAAARFRIIQNKRAAA